ncbi:MAG: hypothetical protein WCF90_04395 [Methanomicrobiales archaeon]
MPALGRGPGAFGVSECKHCADDAENKSTRRIGRDMIQPGKFRERRERSRCNHRDAKDQV